MQQNELQKLGAHIHALRKKRKLTLSALCYQNGLEPSTVSRIEAGLVEAKYGTLLKLAEAFGMPLYEFLNFEKYDLKN